MALKDEGARRRILLHFTLVALGIPLVLGIATLVFELVADRPTSQSATVLYLVVAGLGLVGLGAWAFFSIFMFGRLWKVFEQVSGPEKLWDFVDGTYLLVGVGISLVAAIAVFYYMFTAHFMGSAALFALAGVLYLLELARFSARVSGITRPYS